MKLSTRLANAGLEVSWTGYVRKTSDTPINEGKTAELMLGQLVRLHLNDEYTGPERTPEDMRVAYLDLGELIRVRDLGPEISELLKRVHHAFFNALIALPGDPVGLDGSLTVTDNSNRAQKRMGEALIEIGTRLEAQEFVHVSGGMILDQMEHDLFELRSNLVIKTVKP